MVALTRIYHPVELWEEVQYNMWGSVDDKADYLQKAIEFTGDHNLYGSYMRDVVTSWTYSCENALTDSSLNRKAWIGHAACALAFQCPENIVRQAWGYLTIDQQNKANNEAANAITLWECAQASSGIHTNVGGEMLPGWHTG